MLELDQAVSRCSGGGCAARQLRTVNRLPQRDFGDPESNPLIAAKAAVLWLGLGGGLALLEEVKQ